MFKVNVSDQKVVAAKKTIKITDVYVDKLKLVDETGDITSEVLEAIPEGIETVSFNISFELPLED